MADTSASGTPNGGNWYDGILDGIKSVSVKDIFTGYATIEQLKINSGMAKSQNNVAEWNAQASLLSLQQQQLFNQQQMAAKNSLFGGNGNAILVFAALAAVAVGVYVVAK